MAPRSSPLPRIAPLTSDSSRSSLYSLSEEEQDHTSSVQFYVRKCIGTWLTYNNRHKAIAEGSGATIKLTQTKLGDYLVRIYGRPACVMAARDALDCIEVYTFPISCLKSAWLNSRRSSPMRGSFNLKDIMAKTETYVELPSFSLGKVDSGIGTIVAARATSVRRALDLMELDNIVVEHIDTSRMSSQAAQASEEWWTMLSERTDTFVHPTYPHGANYIIVVGRQRGIIDVKRSLTVVTDAL
ncbi:hypothetical protein AAVH_19484 [Aphelenchoides avenae]|nr:hypothetical protein AAVH_19484 [Aphelenchus avenae]